MSEVPDLYTNSIRASASLYEFVLLLYLQTPGEDNEVVTQEVGRVRMSPQQAMALHMLLGQHLRAYGEKFQEVFLPEELAKRLRGEDQGSENEAT